MPSHIFPILTNKKPLYLITSPAILCYPMLSYAIPYSSYNYFFYFLSKTLDILKK